MKKTLIYIILPFVVLTLASLIAGEPERAEIKLKDITIADTDSIEETQDPRIAEEIKYYLDRHNVQDEGYEMVVAYANGKRHSIDISPYIPVRNVGTWANYSREGTALVLDSLGRTIIAKCDADTLEHGYRADTLGTYVGDFTGDKAQGHGAYLTADKGYFEGHWENDQREGFGLQLLKTGKDGPRFRVGEWTKNKFMGERMKYTTERIYGIDIARYQHGRGRRAIPILWNKLRITHVGKRGSQNVSGTADYPVSFIYIKSTEGTTVRNKFYVNDYAHAKKQGIRAGAYHFFSVRSSGEDQAYYFLNHTLFRSGDLPPVLDIEPSNAQIKMMGGKDKLFHHIRTWLKIVEKRVGVKPILYVNQLFVNNYLSKEPDLKRDYRVWIARYSEYKPDLRLTYWQLCPDGRVAGIRGDVDINVFNGYQHQFEEYLEEETIK